ncbi:MAG TPA: site-specific integrase, partial [Acidimicrobiales bacterium]
KVTPLAPQIVEQLIHGVPHRYQALIIFGAGTGVRIGEAIGVTTDRIDWLRRTVLIDRQLTGVKDGLPAFGPVKDQKNRPRTIPLGDVVIGALADHVRKFGTGPEGLVFTSAKGGPVWQPSFSRIWSPVAGPLGIPAGDGFHQLRHFYASTLIRAGESVKVVQERLGHASAAMTLDVYSHLWPEDEERTRSAVDRVLGDLVSPPCHPEEAVD